MGILFVVAIRNRDVIGYDEYDKKRQHITREIIVDYQIGPRHYAQGRRVERRIGPPAAIIVAAVSEILRRLFLKFFDDAEQQREGEALFSAAPYRAVIEAPYRWRD